MDGWEGGGAAGAGGGGEGKGGAGGGGGRGAGDAACASLMPMDAMISRARLMASAFACSSMDTVCWMGKRGPLGEGLKGEVGVFSPISIMPHHYTRHKGASVLK